MKLNLKKGKIGINSYLDDYLKSLEANHFVINGDLIVPRSEARKFKQNYLNGFITAELQISPSTPSMCLIKKAIIVDESNDIRYNLLESRFLNIGNRLTYDKESNVYWLTKIHNQQLTLRGAMEYAKMLSHLDYRWRIPTLNELKKLHRTLPFYYFSFPDDELHTSPALSEYNHQYNPTSNDTDKESINDRESIVFVTDGELNRRQYKIYSYRYIKLENRLIFDTVSKLIWFTSPISNKQMTWIEADKFVKNFNYNGLKGWRMPKNSEFRSLYNSSILRLDKNFKFPDDEFHTIPKMGEYDEQYNPLSNGTDRESINDKESVVAVM